jgi:hypothetical protein
MRYVAGFLYLLTVVHAVPKVELGETLLVGRDVIASKQEFFGGELQPFL